MACSATATGSRCRRCWPASPTRSPTKAFSTSSRTRSGTPTAIWRRLLEVLPERRGVLIIDGTSFPKQGTHSVGVARQYCGALGKIANCQVAVTAALWTGARAWVTGALLYLPKEWLSDAIDGRWRRFPPAPSFQEKWRQALTLIRRARAAGLQITAVLADAEFGDVTAFRRALHRWRLPYAVGISRHLTVFPGTPAVHVPPSGRIGRPRSQLVLVHETRPIAVRALALALPARAWRRVTWRNGTNRPWAARFAAVRVTPANDWRDRRLAPEVWLLCEQDLGATPRTKYFFVNLPASASMKQLVRLAHQRWAIEQQYQELKTELGFDHFEGRSYPGWQHHVVLTAVAYAFLQRERHASRCRRVAHVSRHSRHRAGDLHGAAAGATTGLFQTHRGIAAN